MRILLVEDVAWDVELIQSALARLGTPFDVHTVATEEQFRAGLTEFQPDIVLADLSLPTFDGRTALRIAREMRRESPFIFVSGSIGEERAVELMRSGATDLVVKHSLHRLAPVVERALRELERRAEARRAMQALREAIDVLLDTKRSFKSKTLGELREKLQRLVETTSWY